MFGVSYRDRVQNFNYDHILGCCYIPFNIILKTRSNTIGGSSKLNLDKMKAPTTAKCGGKKNSVDDVIIAKDDVAQVKHKEEAMVQLWFQNSE
jgi:hypothetical protein